MYSGLLKGGAFLLILVVLLSGFAFIANAQTRIPSCNLYDSTKPVSQGFGAAYDVFSAGKEVLVDAQCFGYPANIQVAYSINEKSDPSKVVYKYGYEWKNNQWSQFTFNAQMVQGDWITGEAKYVFNRSAQEMQNTSYFAAYVCTKVGNEWKCGCADSACTQHFWQLQAYKYP